MGSEPSLSIRVSSDEITSDSFSYSDTDLGSEYSGEVLHPFFFLNVHKRC